VHGRGYRGRVHPGLAARAQGDRGVPRRLQADPAAVDQPGRRWPTATSCPTSAPRSPTSSRSAATRATSPSVCTTTSRRARSSCAWPRKAR
jgi:hypothetical protein